MARRACRRPVSSARSRNRGSERAQSAPFAAALVAHRNSRGWPDGRRTRLGAGRLVPGMRRARAFVQVARLPRVDPGVGWAGGEPRASRISSASNSGAQVGSQIRAHDSKEKASRRTLNRAQAGLRDVICSSSVVCYGVIRQHTPQRLNPGDSIPVTQSQ